MNRAFAATQRGGNDCRRRGCDPAANRQTPWRSCVLFCFLEETSHILIHNSENSSPHMVYQMELAEEAILGQRSAASFATGPVIPDPFISPLGFTITPALSISQPSTPILTLEVEEHAVLSSPALSLSHHDGGHDYTLTCIKRSLPFLRSSGLPFFTEAMNISPGPKQSSQKREKPTASRESVQTSTPASDGNNVQILGTGVIGTVDHSADRETETHSELVSSGTTASYKSALRSKCAYHV